MALKTLKRNKKDLKWPKIIIAILSTIGIVDTGSITLKNWGLFTSLSCPGTPVSYTHLTLPTICSV